MSRRFHLGVHVARVGNIKKCKILSSIWKGELVGWLRRRCRTAFKVTGTYTVWGLRQDNWLRLAWTRKGSPGCWDERISAPQEAWLVLQNLVPVTDLFKSKEPAMWRGFHRFHYLRCNSHSAACSRIHCNCIPCNNASIYLIFTRWRHIKYILRSRDRAS